MMIDAYTLVENLKASGFDERHPNPGERHCDERISAGLSRGSTCEEFRYEPAGANRRRDHHREKMAIAAAVQIAQTRNRLTAFCATQKAIN